MRTERAAGDLKFLLFGDPGGDVSGADAALAGAALRRADVALISGYEVFDVATRVIRRDPELIDFETRFMLEQDGYPALQAVAPAVSALRLERAEGQIAAATDLVTTGPNGVFVAIDAAVAYDGTVDVGQWIVNPFALFSRVLARWPAPDVTTLNGRRIYYSQVDGDGWNNVCEFEGCAASRTIAARAMLNSLIAPYPDLPVSVALVGADLEREFGGSPASAEVARDIFKLPQVEIASHTYSHPFIWRFFEDYSRETELNRLRDIDDPAAGRHRGFVPEAVEGLAATLSSLDVRPGVDSRYVASDVYAPRAFLRHPFDLDQEISGSLALAGSLGRDGAPARLIQWSGDAAPFEAAVRAARLAGAANLNGGGARFDALSPSMIWVWPIGRQTGAERQIYSSQSNENDFTHDWKGPFYGFLAVRHTVRRTETPRRLKAFNIYYHSFSAQKLASLRSVAAMLDLAREQPLAPVCASRYAEIATGFYTADLVPLGPRRWRVRDRGALQTLRVDDAAGVGVDYGASVGVLGHRRRPAEEDVAEALYVSLDPAVAEPVLALSEHAQPARRAERFVLRESRWLIEGLAQTGCAARFAASGYGAGEMTWRAPAGAASRALVRARRGGETLLEQTAEIADDGALRTTLEIDAIAPVVVEIDACDEAAR